MPAALLLGVGRHKRLPKSRRRSRPAWRCPAPRVGAFGSPTGRGGNAGGRRQRDPTVPATGRRAIGAEPAEWLAPVEPIGRYAGSVSTYAESAGRSCAAVSGRTTVHLPKEPHAGDQGRCFEKALGPPGAGHLSAIGERAGSCGRMTSQRLAGGQPRSRWWSRPPPGERRACGTVVPHRCESVLTLLENSTVCEKPVHMPLSGGDDAGCCACCGLWWVVVGVVSAGWVWCIRMTDEPGVGLRCCRLVLMLCVGVGWWWCGF